MPAKPANDELKEAAKKFFAASFDGVLKLAPAEQAPLWVDGHQSPPEVSLTPPAKTEADCIWHGAAEILQQALFSIRSFESAYISGRVTISGDMSLLTRLGKPEKK
ncbi:hypothetical protein [Hyphococcus lacteus]|uniref:SCP2 domain-containing protein n=1 Tax=Hyphococcus lacteus TaxID=3143536 RepID=A0ABV3Z1H6_9PROT